MKFSKPAEERSRITGEVLVEVLREREKQDAKWGEQNHPFHDPVLTGRRDGVDEVRLAEEYEIPTGSRAKQLTEYAARRRELCFAKILVEEVAEACGEQDPRKLREELVQVAATAVAAIEALDRKHGAPVYPDLKPRALR